MRKKNSKVSNKIDAEILKEYQDEILKLRNEKKGIQDSIVFLRALVSKGISIDDHLIQLIPQKMMYVYEIKLYKSLIVRTKKRNLFLGFIVGLVLKNEIRLREKELKA